MPLFPPICKVMAGHWTKDSQVCVGDLKLIFYKGNDVAGGEHVNVSQLSTVELATEETVQKLGSTVGLGLVGSVLLGPVGLIAGVLMARKKEATFIFTLKDGRTAMLTGDSRAYTQMQASIMQNSMQKKFMN